MNTSRASMMVYVVVSLLAGTVSAVNIETVPVGNPGNAGELSGLGAGGHGPDRICGSVGYTYNIGKYEVTARQYTAFLNAVAATDTYNLYNPSMWSDSYGCKIQRSGTSGSYTYRVESDWANRPVNFVSWGDAARFANWLHNGQPTGPQGLSTTEDGAYYLHGAMTNAQLLMVNRKSDWKWAITSEDEWYKAAYHKNDGVTANYWDYPTGTNAAPSNVVTSPDSGNNANWIGAFGYGTGTWCIGDPYYRTEVGEFENSESPYGTFDQGGNVAEWDEAVLYGSYRGVRGGLFASIDILDLHATDRYDVDSPMAEYSGVGFRVVQVPEPATLMLLALGGLVVIRR